MTVKYRGEENRDKATTYPAPGRYYIVGGIKKGEGLSHMAAAAYGNGRRWREIWKPNKKIARSSDPNRSFWPGDVIWIPGDAIEEGKKEELRKPAAEQLTDVGPNDMTIIIEGERIPITEGQVVVAMDTVADGYNVKTAWNPDNEKHYRLFKPYGYQETAVYIGGRLRMRGRLYKPSPSFSSTSRDITLEGWSFSADLIDTQIKPPFERNKVKLFDRISELAEGFGIMVEWDESAGDDKPFDRVTAEDGMAIFDHISELTKQRAVQIASTPQGNLKIYKFKAGKSVCSFVENETTFQGASASYDGRVRFSAYTAKGQSPGKHKASATSNDPAVPSYRITSFNADEQASGDLQKAADWQRNKALGESMSLPIKYHSWYRPDGQQWELGDIVTVVSKSLFLKDGFDFAVKQIAFDLTLEGATCALTLVPPQVYNGEEIPNPFT